MTLISDLRAASGRLAAVGARMVAATEVLARGNATAEERSEMAAVVKEHAAANRAMNKAFKALAQAKKAKP